MKKILNILITSLNSNSDLLNDKNLSEYLETSEIRRDIIKLKQNIDEKSKELEYLIKLKERYEESESEKEEEFYEPEGEIKEIEYRPINQQIDKKLKQKVKSDTFNAKEEIKKIKDRLNIEIDQGNIPKTQNNKNIEKLIRRINLYNKIVKFYSLNSQLIIIDKNVKTDLKKMNNKKYIEYVNEVNNLFNNNILNGNVKKLIQEERWGFGLDQEQLIKGIKVELEHGKVNPLTNITNDDPVMTAKIALAHLNEIPDYYTKLEKIEGGNVYQKLANSYRAKYCKNQSRPLYSGEWHPGCANFEGPGTRIELKNVRDMKPYNNIDACAKIHDLEYERAFKIEDPILRESEIRKADNKVQKCFDKFPNEEPYYSIGKAGIGTKMKTEDLIPIVSKSISGRYFGSKHD